MGYFTSQRRAVFWAMILLLLCVAIFGAQNLQRVFWTDEIRSLYRAGDPAFGGTPTPLQVWQRTAEVSDQVPGYYFLLAVWRSLVSLTPVTGRYLSLLLGLLAVAWTYRLGKDLHSPLAGLGAATVLGSGVLFVNYLHDMRTYTLLVLMSAICLWLYWRIAIRRRAGSLLQIAFTFCVAGLLYIHYFSFILIAAICLYHLLFVPKERYWWKVTGLITAAGILFIPWILTSFTVSNFGDPAMRKADAFSPSEMVRQVLDMFSNGNIGLWLIVGVFALDLRDRIVQFIWYMLIFAFLFAMLINGWLYVISEVRYLMILWVPLALLTGLGFVRLKQAGLRPVFLIGIWVLIAITSNFGSQLLSAVNPPMKYLPWDILSRELNQRTKEGDVLAFETLVDGWDGGQDEVMAYYFHAMPLKPALVESLPIMSDEEYLSRGGMAIAGAKRIWVSYDPHLRPWRAGMFNNMLNQKGYTSCGTISDTLDLFTELFSQAPQTFTTHFSTETGQRIANVNLVELMPRAEDKSLYVTLEWTLEANTPPDTYSVGIHVLDNAGNLVAQVDYGLPNASFGCQSTKISLNQLPSGQYSVHALVYAWETNVRLSVQSITNNRPSDYDLLGSFHLP
jgi:hypothetical protein